MSIIGVIAVITIPALITKIQNYQYLYAFKKESYIISNALIKMATDNGCIGDLACTGVFKNGMTQQHLEDIGDALTEYIKTSENCRASKDQSCWVTSYNTYFDGTGTQTNPNYNTSAGWYKFITADGSAIAISDYGSICNTSTAGMSKLCGELWLDVNGPKEPNYYGRDIFSFYITNNPGLNLYPRGGSKLSTNGWNYNDLNKCAPDSTGTEKDGKYCAGRIIEKGWVMDY